MYMKNTSIDRLLIDCLLQEKNIAELKVKGPSLRLLELPDDYEKKMLRPHLIGLATCKSNSNCMT